MMRIKCDQSQQLEKGAYAIVFQGTLDKTQQVAVKRIQLAGLNTESGKTGEEALLHLNHQNVIKLLHSENDTNFRYYALELCKASLDKLYLKGENKYCGPVPQQNQMFLQLADGLRYIHDKKLVHRDIKPENVLIWVGHCAYGFEHVLMKWADFGLCKPTNESGSFSMSGVKGTLDWFAPELLKAYEYYGNIAGMRGTNKSDVFAEGLIFGYILLEGQHPFGTKFQIFHNLSQNNPVNLEKITKRHKRLVDELINKQLKPNPEERMTADEVFKYIQEQISRHPESYSDLGEGSQRAAIVVHQNSRLTGTNMPRYGVDILQLPLKKHETVTPGVSRYVFGDEPSNLPLVGKRCQKTILLVGASGSGKSNLINAMVNYILGVKWSDDFRFKLIDEQIYQSQAHIKETDLVTVYDLYQMKGSRLDYSLTVVDTPEFGDTSGLEKDKDIVEKIQDYFKSNQEIQQLEAVCFVVQSALPRLTPTQLYIFNSILSIFSQEFKDNIRLMVTFADIARPPVLAAVKEAYFQFKTGLPLHHKFNNSIFFTSKKSSSEVNEINEIYFNVAVEGFDQFFDDLSRMEAKSLTLTREVLEERTKLEALIKGLEIRTLMKPTLVDELEKIKKILEQNPDQIALRTYSEFEVLFTIPIDISGTGQSTTNCLKCEMTCHFPCRQANDENKNQCSVMNSKGNCMICKCHWSKHCNQKYRHEMARENVMKTASDFIHQHYQKAHKEQLTNEQLLKYVEKDIEEQEEQSVELMQATYPHIRRLDEIALRPLSSFKPTYFELMIAAETRENRQDCWNRIPILRDLNEMAAVTAKLVEGQSKMGSSPTNQIEWQRSLLKIVEGLFEKYNHQSRKAGQKILN